MDGDWGGDELQLTAVLLAHRNKVKIVGASCVFGNTTLDNVVRNALDVLYFLQAGNIPVYVGAAAPSGSDPQQKDHAHGRNGIGNVELARSPFAPQTEAAVDFILRTLREADKFTVTITASGPLTNIAQALEREPETMRRVKQIIIMGGCTEGLKAFGEFGNEKGERWGNITPYAEFNFQQAADDAKLVFSYSNLPITLVPLNCTHQLHLTPDRLARIADTYRLQPHISDCIASMMTPAAHLNQAKFRIGGVMHDVQCANYLLYPELFLTQRGNVDIHPFDGKEPAYSMSGHSSFTTEACGSVTVVEGMVDPDRLFDIFLTSITFCISPFL